MDWLYAEHLQAALGHAEWVRSLSVHPSPGVEPVASTSTEGMMPAHSGVVVLPSLSGGMVPPVSSSGVLEDSGIDLEY